PRYIALSRHLPIAAFHRLSFSPQSNRLAQKQTRRVVVRIGKVRLLRLAIGIARGARRGVQPEALQQFGIVVELASLPQLDAQERAFGPGISGLRPRRKTVLA